ncbi:MAG: hypothetical protein A4E20_17595 [Nitrospira sp. SG-bin2]|nr:MAG: hypothetical protein A4E20_17595 [Nitrospira sp. SG-bin2]
MDIRKRILAEIDSISDKCAISKHILTRSKTAQISSSQQATILKPLYLEISKKYVALVSRNDMKVSQ